MITGRGVSRTMSEIIPNNFYDKRELYQMSPKRYDEVISLRQIRKLFVGMGDKWKKNRDELNYADLGCGDCEGTKKFGDFLKKSLGMSVNATGFDASGVCEFPCKERGISFHQIDFGSEQIPINDVQVFTLFETIEHIFFTDFLLESIRKSISEDGILLITTLNVVCWKNRLLVPLGIQPFNTEVSTKKLSYGYKFNFLKKRMDTWKPAGHIRPFTMNSLKEILEDNRFDVISSYGLENWRAFKFLEKIAKNACTGMLMIAKPS